MHQYFNFVEEECIKADITMKVLVNKLQEYDIHPSAEFIKEMWKSIQTAHTGKKSTTELTTKEVGQVFEIFNKLLGELKIHVPFPSISQLITEE